MKIFVLKISIFVALFFITDRILGAIFKYLDDRNETEKSTNFIMSKVNQDVLIFGSSRAYRHYDPRIITDSLGLSCFNCGQSGQGFIHNFVLLSTITNRHIPKLIIYDVYPPFDFYEGENIRYIKDFRPYNNNELIQKTLLIEDSSEKYKLFSKMYCYNDICNKIIARCFPFLRKEKTINGYVPTYQGFDTALLKRNHDKSFKIDSLKLYFAQKFIDLSNQSKIVLVMSPSWYGCNKHYSEQLCKFSQENGVPFIDFTSDSRYFHNNELFIDGIHMNAKGSDLFTRDLIYKLKGVVELNRNLISKKNK